MSQPIFYEGLRDRILPKVESGELSLDTPLSSIADSLDLVELTLELEEMKVEVDVPIKTVGDFLWLVKNIEFRKSRTR
jgi:acyl carrier protein